MDNEILALLKALLDTLNSIQEILFYVAIAVGVPVFRLSMQRVNKRQKEVQEAAARRVNQLEKQAQNRIDEQAELLKRYRVDMDALQAELKELRESNAALTRTVELWRPDIEELPVLKNQYSAVQKALEREHNARLVAERELIEEKARRDMSEADARRREDELRQEIQTLRETIKRNEAAAKRRESELNRKIQEQATQLKLLVEKQTDELKELPEADE